MKKNIRGTKDIDLGVYVPSEKEYNELRKKLVNEYHYSASKENSFCLIDPSGREIDLLPFGEIETEGQVMIEGKGITKIGLDGFQESYELGLIETQIGEEKYFACSIPAIVLLKLIAFDDRPNRRIKDVKDVKDINAICKHYPEIESEAIWSDHFDLYSEEREHHEVARIALGREMRKIIEPNSRLKKRVINILDNAINQESTFLPHMIDDSMTETLEGKAQILLNIKQGIIE